MDEETLKKLVILGVSATVFSLYIRGEASKKNDPDIFSMQSRYGRLSPAVSRVLNTKMSIAKKNVYIRRNSFPVAHHMHAAVAAQFLGVSPSNIIAFMAEFKRRGCNSPEEYQRKNPQYDMSQHQVKWENLTNEQHEEHQKYVGGETNFYGIRDMFVRDWNEDYKHGQDSEIDSLFRMLADRYPFLSKGMIGIAIHSPIQLGYSIAVNDIDGIIDGLAQHVYGFHSVPYTPTDASGKIAGMAKAKTLVDALNVMHENEYTHFEQLIQQYQNQKGLTQFAPDPNKTYPQNVGIFRRYGAQKISNYLKCMIDQGIVMQCDENTQFIELKSWIMRNTILLYTYCEARCKNDFFLLHGVTSGWSVCEILKAILKVVEKQKAAAIINEILFQYLLAMLYIYAACHTPMVVLDANREKKPKEELRRLIAEKVREDIVPDYWQCKNVEPYTEEHRIKLTQCVLDALELKIIDEQIAWDAIRGVTDKYTRP